jgi:hypothetical protein
MDFGTVAVGAVLLALVGLFVWFCVVCLRFLFRVMSSPMNSSGAAQYPNGADEPDGSSYSVVRGDVRLD